MALLFLQIPLPILIIVPRNSALVLSLQPQLHREVSQPCPPLKTSQWLRIVIKNVPLKFHTYTHTHQEFTAQSTFLSRQDVANIVSAYLTIIPQTSRPKEMFLGSGNELGLVHVSGSQLFYFFKDFVFLGQS